MSAPLVIIGGWSLDATTYEPALDRLSALKPSMVVSLGDEARQCGELSLDALSQQIEERVVSRHPNSEPVTFISDSLGASIAIDIVARNPGLVKRAILVSPIGLHDPGFRSLHWITNGIKAITTLPGFSMASKLGFTSLKNLVLHPVATSRVFNLAVDTDMKDAAHKAKLSGVPIHVLRGTKDYVVDDKSVQGLSAVLDTEIDVIPGASHWMLPQAHPKLMNKLQSLVML